MTAEHDRLHSDAEAWRQWGPYLSERAWGHRARGRQCEWHGVGLPPARPRAPARIAGNEDGPPASATYGQTSA